MITKPWTKNYPDKVPLNIDTPNITLKDMLEKATKDFSNKNALSCHGEKLTFDEINNYSDKFAGFLQNKWKLQKGDHIAIMLPNLLQFPIVIFALVKLGCAFVNINPLYTSREVKGILQDSKAKGVIVLSGLAHNVEAIADKCEDLKYKMVTDIADLYPTPKKQIISFVVKYIKGMKDKYSKDKFDTFTDALKSDYTPNYTNIELKPDDIAALQYSSGTTGTPKGTILLHRNIVANIYQIKAWTEGFDIELSEQIVLTALPIYHIFSLTANLFLFYCSGAFQILIPNPKDIKSLVAEMRKSNFSTIFAVNTLYIALLNNKKFRQSKFPNFKLSISGGMSTSEAVASEWKKITGVNIKEGYGLSEMSPVVTVNSLLEEDFSGSVGFPLPNTDIKIYDDKGNELPQGETGEIWVTGPQKSPGFWSLPEINREHFTDDGWLKTGDMGYLDEQGRLVISGRIKHMIIVSGFNVFPKEVELVLTEKEEIEDAAVIKGHSNETGEMPIAFIVLKNDKKLTEKEIFKYCETKLAHYKLPRKIIFIDELPKNTVGKIDVNALQKEYAEKYENK
ncbi:long-chain-fatty-acid--CoA ligase [Francisella philomiragia]|uniref:long-chain-fatty-acid--CoA ligase n=1 Tax=Francisella philomiragia TaxID=28110 RepID=UPI0019068DB9|nr:long-chain fatty acid--CoA ligase [Francisella philomiragia]MBK2267723.1 long-chain fatty acid--CoA ligase [Francisella philomiragia]MBK2279178.1 long-chain fatty acid--CoA ligase [Francisella philomiragia]MBK2287033.1 long-chain fatty acid--CoA ligase [Francisella philomiragia]MBK2289010.1 long-chain fatty acid--CoA ligase [Francisella philomiragia]MBK2290728.1 long-chain fatty acid--CoA ligase [Francisella philomiragia]